MSKPAGVTSNSTEVKPGFTFVAVRGETRDGHEFLAAAAKAGASLLVGEKDDPQLSVAYRKVADSRLELARLAAEFHGHPTRAMKVVGVTGTSGKTTTTYIIESILSAAGYRVGVIGTVNFRFGGKVLPSTHTTPGPVELQALIARMRDDGCNALVMEVSSHALKQHRAAFVEYDGMVFSNLSREHLDFHPDMDDYFAAKKLLFTRSADVSAAAGKHPVAAINADDDWGRKLLGELAAGARTKTTAYGMSAGAAVSGAALSLDLGGVRGQAAGVAIDSKLVGRFNAYNILAAVAVTQAMGVPAQDIARGVHELKSVPGRIEAVPNKKGVHVLVDYAHKPDALQKVLETLKQSLDEANAGKAAKARLITVFGCGGDRDRTKRPVMGKIACELSQRVFITSDNPRTEKPEAIISEIVAGLSGRRNFEVEPDRRKAIFAALAQAAAGDVVVIAGKGHEDYQIIADAAAPGGTRKIHFDDREVAAEALGETQRRS